MRLFNKKKRIQYLGFDDFWFSFIGILIISSITSFMFNDMSMSNPLIVLVIRWVSCFFFTVSDWLIIRGILIFLRRKYPNFKDDFKRITSLVFAIIVTILIVDFFGGKFLTHFFRFFDINSTYSMQLKVLMSIMIIIVMDMAIYEAIYYHIRLKKSIREEEQTKQVVIQAQLDTLKNQAQPHFLFNSLNTLRDIIDQDSKEDAKKFVDNLSDVYRFILDSDNANLTSLQKELKFAKAYIHIQSERFGDNLKMDWNIPEDKLATMVAPMSLQLLIENAIKHNIVSRAKPLIIKVEVKKDYLVVSNKIQVKSTQISSTKIGLKNIEKRYKLISNKTIDVKNNGNYFIVSLPLLKLFDKKKNDANTNN